MGCTSRWVITTNWLSLSRDKIIMGCSHDSWIYIYINWVMVSMVTPGIPTGDWPLPFSVCQMMIDNLRDLQVQDSGYGNNENRAAFGQITKSILKKKRKCGVVFGFYLRRVKFMMAYVFLCHRIPLRETLPRTSIWFFVEMKDTKSSPWVQY